jgi:hypothetical protein
MTTVTHGLLPDELMGERTVAFVEPEVHINNVQYVVQNGSYFRATPCTALRCSRQGCTNSPICRRHRKILCAIRVTLSKLRTKGPHVRRSRTEISRHGVLVPGICESLVYMLVWTRLEALQCKRVEWFSLWIRRWTFWFHNRPVFFDRGANRQLYEDSVLTGTIKYAVCPTNVLTETWPHLECWM